MGKLEETSQSNNNNNNSFNTVPIIEYAVL